MLKVGLTGNIASGKSSVARVWRSLGARVIDADELARRAVRPGTPALAAIAERWGPRVLDARGELDREAVRGIVFAEPAERKWLESVVHPAVATLRDAEHRAAAEAGEPIVVSDIPLLFEAGLEDKFDSVVLVHAPEEARRARLVELRGLEPETAERMMGAQMDSELKLPRADHVIVNDGSLDALRRRAVEVWRLLEEREASTR